MADPGGGASGDTHRVSGMVVLVSRVTVAACRESCVPDFTDVHMATHIACGTNFTRSAAVRKERSLLRGSRAEHVAAFPRAVEQLRGCALLANVPVRAPHRREARRCDAARSALRQCA